MSETKQMELVLLVRRPPGRGHLYRFAGQRFTVGAAPEDDLRLEGPGISPGHLVFARAAGGYAVRAAAGATINGRRLDPDGGQPIDTADAIELGDRLIEVAVERDPAPTTDRHDAGRLRRSQAAEQRVREAAGPSLWVLRGAAAGLAVPVDVVALSCGAGPGDGLVLPDPGVEPGHFTVQVAPDGRVRLTACAPVRVRGRTITEGWLAAGDLVFVGGAVCELRAPPGDRAGRARWPVVGLSAVALALALLAAAWWVELN